jgi:succinate dehydrogenase / fumarate reductase iron-sulfur subunit
MDREGFGNCTNHYECEAVCPKGISVKFIADLNRDFFKSTLVGREFSALPPPIEIEE